MKRLENCPYQKLLDALKFSNVFTGNTMKEEITVIKLVTVCCCDCFSD